MCATYRTLSDPTDVYIESVDIQGYDSLYETPECVGV
jgi:hypothetical protein